MLNRNIPDGPVGRPQRPHLAQINVIRVMAMLGIFLHHTWKGVPHFEVSSAFLKLLVMGFDFGSLGVVFFNIASGFVLALPHLGAGGKPDVPGWGQFMKKRFLRIVPPYYMAILLFTGCNILAFHQDLLPSLVTLVRHALFVQAFEYSTLMTDFASYWYLSMLAQFYVLFPLVLRLFLRFGAPKAFFVVTVVCWGGFEILDLYVRANPDSGLGMADYLAYFNLPARLPEFAVGMWLAAAWNPGPVRSRRLPVDGSFACLSAAAIVFAAVGAPFAAGMHTPVRTIYEAACCFVGFMVLFLPGRSASLGASRIVARLAAASYSIYLVHQPMLTYLYRWVPRMASPWAELTLLGAMAAPLCIALGFSMDWAARRLTTGGVHLSKG